MTEIIKNTFSIGSNLFRMYAATENGILIGTLQAGGWQNNIPFLRDLSVDEKHRRKGIGKLLLAAVIADAKYSSKSAINLSVSKDNSTAISLYESNGFRKCVDHGDGEIWLYLEIGGVS